MIVTSSFVVLRLVLFSFFSFFNRSYIIGEVNFNCELLYVISH